MTDDDKALVERLRSNRPIPTLPHEAADSIEALSAENERLREALSRVYKIKPQEPLSQQSEWTEATARAALGETE